jgi:hypothetical protein
MFEKSRKRRGRPFVKGDPHAGRPKGATNVASREIKDVARRILEDAAYQARLVTRLRAGRAPHVEVLLFHYAFGKPVERHEVTTAITDFSKLSDDELMAQFEATFQSLRAEQRVDGGKELLPFPSEPTTG